jgi:hypothetical protein
MQYDMSHSNALKSSLKPSRNWRKLGGGGGELMIHRSVFFRCGSSRSCKGDEEGLLYPRSPKVTVGLSDALVKLLLQFDKLV